MKLCYLKITPLFMAILLAISTRAESKVSLNGEAELSYTTYSATFDKISPLYISPVGSADEDQVSFHGTSFVQKYAAVLTATNLTMRGQRQYYNLMVGYDWKQFNTRATDNDSTNTFKGAAGNINFNGRIVYEPMHLPIALDLAAYDGRAHAENANIFPNEIIHDGMSTSIEDGGTISGWRGTFVFEPQRSSNLTLRGLPRLHVDYRERNAVSPDQISDKTRELAVAGLSKESNWINYRYLQYERNQLGSISGYTEQAIQIGLVDYRKKRNWSALTNWINISADGQLTLHNTLFSGDTSEEYDLNFFAIATRRTWNARTFLNYNRNTSQLSNAQGTSLERYKIPIIVKGIWGRDTDWFFRVSTDSSLEKENGLRKSTTNSASLSMGGTTFKNSSFSFAPAISFSTYKSDVGNLYYDAGLSLVTTSNSRFSRKWDVSASSHTKYKDDGSADGVSWNQSFLLKTTYKPDTPYMYRLSENIQLGSGKDFIDMGNQTTIGLTGNTINNRRTDRNNGIADYLRSITIASFSWKKSAAFSTSIDASYDVMSNDSTLDTITEMNHKLAYSKKDAFFNLDTTYRLRDANGDSAKEFVNTGLFQYRPDTRNEGVLRYTYTRSSSKYNTASAYELSQRYSLKFFSKSGVARNLAAVTEEFTYKNQSSESSYALSLSGRYYPTSKTALYASVRASSGSGMLTLIYGAGASADFKLLSTSVDYTSAKRDIDHRTEQKIATSIKRTF